MYTLKSSTGTYHIDSPCSLGTGAPGRTRVRHLNPCVAVRSWFGLAQGRSFASPAEALKSADILAEGYDMSVCRPCRAAVMTMVLDEAYAEYEARESL